MVPQAADVVAKLGADVLLKGVGQVVDRAGEHEVLPDKQAQLVADIVEPVVRVEAAAPDADAVHVGGSGVLQEPSRASRVHAGQQIVLGDIVGAHGKDVHAVDAVAEALAPIVPAAGDRHRAQADAAAPAVERRPARREPDGDGIQRLLAEARGPPELRRVDDDFAVLARAGEDAPVRPCDGDADRRPARRDARHMGLHAQSDAALLVLLQHQHVPDAGRVDADERDIAPDAGIRQARAPVPAEHAVGLAQKRETDHRVGAAVGRVFGVGLADKLCRRGKADLDPVFPLAQQRLDVVLPDAVHVVGPADGRAVEGDFSQRVQPLAAQEHRFAGEQRGVGGKAARIEKVVLHELERFVFVVAEEGVGDAPGGEQVVIDRAGHLRRDEPEVRPRDGKAPCAVE